MTIVSKPNWWDKWKTLSQQFKERSDCERHSHANLWLPHMLICVNTPAHANAHSHILHGKQVHACTDSFFSSPKLLPSGK